MITAVGTVGSSAQAPGQSMSVAGYDLRYRGVEESRGANAQEIRAVVDVSRGGEELGTLRPGKNRYFAEQQVSNEAAIRSDRLNGEDLFLIADQIDPDETLFLKALVKPLVNVIWIAGFVFLLGAGIALWPDAREQRRLALRYGTGDSLVGA